MTERNTHAESSPRSARFDAPPAGALYAIYTMSFQISRTYDNPYDPAAIDVQAEFELPSSRKITFPAFWFQDYTVVPGSETRPQCRCARRRDFGYQRQVGSVLKS